MISESLGPYRVLAKLGEGGMGEVYRARDTRLGREVALKVLPPTCASDPDRIARFQREAQVLASLNHPHIAAIYGLEEAEDVRALVLELVEGDTLAERIARGPIAVDEALAIATQIAAALEAAHEQGIIHRDLKPANIKVDPNGRVKVLDFGLAKLTEQPASAANPSTLSMSPTITTPAMTQIGMILGTAAYMSPEQAKGKPADKRSDVWAFGCVLYEMLTGKRAFDGEDVSETLASVLKGEPDWTAVPSNNRVLHTLLRRCLHRTPRQRFGDAAAIAVLLPDAAIEPVEPAPAPRATSRMRWMAIGAAVGAVAAALALYAMRSLPRAAAASPRVFELSVPSAFNYGAVSPGAISPDGSRVAFAATNAQGGIDVMLRRLDGSADQLLASTRGAHSLFWSPDSRWIAFYDSRQLMRVDTAGGVPPELLAKVAVPQGRGGAWSSTGEILFTDERAIKRLDLNTRAVTSVTRPPAEGESHLFPAFLPGGDRFMFTARRSAGPTVVMIASIDGSNVRQILQATSQVIPTSDGFVLFARDGTLLAQRFDPDTESFAGDPQPVATGIFHLPDTTAMGVSVADDSTLIYALRREEPNNVLRWYPLDGGPPRPVPHERLDTAGGGFSLSPDGNRVLVPHAQPDANVDIWMVDARDGKRTRVTNDAARETAPVWSPDGRSVVFQRQGVGLMRVAVDTRREELLRRGQFFLHQWSADGKFIVFARADESGAQDLWAAPADASAKEFKVAEGPFEETQGQLSGDSKWLAFASDETGSWEVYVQEFPSGANRRPVSQGGGRMPRWSPDSRTIYYLTAAGDLVTVSFDPSNATVSTPQARLSLKQRWRNQAFRYAVHDGAVLSMDFEEPAIQSRVMLNWTAALKK
jgi:Tol biopolymer transport system component